MRHSSRLVIVAATAATFMAASPAVFAVADAEFLKVYQVMQRAQGGDKSAIADAVAGFAELVKVEPANPVLLVNLGAATSMQSRTTMMPWKKISYAEDGMALQDKALALLTPAHDIEVVNGNKVSLSVRFVAANTWLAVPGFFNRGERGEKLLTEVLQSPLFDQAPLQFKGAVWMRAARLATDQKRPEDVKRYLGLVIDSSAPQAALAKEQLAAP